jgi:ribosome biogenesis GTPase A
MILHVCFQVLDARDPMGSRASAVEEAVLGRAGKKLVLVLNKVMFNSSHAYVTIKLQ